MILENIKADRIIVVIKGIEYEIPKDMYEAFCHVQDLVTENERLKAKLEKINEACYATYLIKDPVKNKQHIMAVNQILGNIIAIINKEDEA